MSAFVSQIPSLTSAVLAIAVGVASSIAACSLRPTTEADSPEVSVDSPPDSTLSKSMKRAPGVEKKFPLAGAVNALIVFVQHRDDEFEQCLRMDGDVDVTSGKSTFSAVSHEEFCAGRTGDGWGSGEFQSWTDDSLTEWPRWLSESRSNLGGLPVWADGLIDRPGSGIVTPGSLTDMYRRISNERFDLRGVVWPYTYRPNNPQDWYKTNSAPYVNGMVRLSREILEYVGANPCGVPGETDCGISWDPSVWDRYTNGDGESVEPDGRFDMIILLFRFSALRSLTGIRNATSITSLGSNSAASIDFLDPLDADPLDADPLLFGSLKVIDNRYEASGVIAEAQSKKHALRIMAHEIGHRQFGYYHTDDDATVVRDRNDYYSLMNGSPHLGVSVADRVKAGWANVQYEDVTKFETLSVTLEDMWMTGSDKPDALWLMAGPSPSCGDVVVEARNRSFSLDKPSVPLIADGDGADFFLPNEGLLIVKAAEGTCAGSNREYSSMPNKVLYSSNDRRWKYFGTTGSYPAFGPGQAYTPHFVLSTTYGFKGNPSLDSTLAITGIQDVGDGFSLTVHSDYRGTTIEIEAAADTYIDKSFPENNFGRSPSLRVVASEEVRYALLAWNLSAIPTGSVVHTVRIRVDVSDVTSPAGFGVFELKRGWSEFEATWLQASDGQAWEAAGASGLADRGTKIVSPFSPRHHGLYSVALNADGVALVQKWIDDPSNNHGIILAYDSPNANEAGFRSREGDGARGRPVLEVTYLATGD